MAIIEVAIYIGSTAIGAVRVTSVYFHFVATVLGFFSGIPQPCIRAEMSRLVEKEEQGKWVNYGALNQSINLPVHLLIIQNVNQAISCLVN